MFYRNLLKELDHWKNSPNRKPLIIRGARQVGKTTLVNEFGKKFKQYIYLNLERKEDGEIFEEFENIEQLITKIFFEKKALKKHLKETLLFIDEIQEAPKVVNLLRYFKEEISDLAVIAAGSMLETLLGKNLTFPVGRVEYKVLRPVSFDEFLKATKEEILLEEFNKIPIEKYAEKKLFEAFHKYALLGGMPEVIQNYSQKRDITELNKIYDALITSYLQDAEKYAKNEQQLQLIRFSIHQAMLKAGHRVTFQGFGESNYSSKAIGEVLRALEKTHLLHIIYPTTSTSMPPEPDYRKTPRIQFLDSGMVNYFTGMQSEILGTKDLNNIYQGTMIEHLVGQEILSFQSLTLKKLHFWVRQKKQSDAEIDFIYPYKSKLVPIEVKSGKTGKLKSLQIFMEQSNINFAIRFYAGSRQLDKLQTSSGKTFYLLNLPYFLATKIEFYLDWLMKNIKYEEPLLMVQESKEIYEKKTKSKSKKIDIYELTKKHYTILKSCEKEPKMGRHILEEILGMTYQSTNKKTYINTLIELGLLDYTDKENIKSKQQKYRTTKKGSELIQSQS